MSASAWVLVFGLASCGTTGDGVSPTAGDWPWWPTRMEVSDLTRVGRPGPDGIRPLEVRVCFEDSQGDLAKAAGSLEIGVSRSTEPDEPVTIEIDLDDPDDAGGGYERVTGCYLVPLRVDLPGLVRGRRLRVEVTYRGGNGLELRDVHEVALDRDM